MSAKAAIEGTIFSLRLIEAISKYGLPSNDDFAFENRPQLFQEIRKTRALTEKKFKHSNATKMCHHHFKVEYYLQQIYNSIPFTCGGILRLDWYVRCLESCGTTLLIDEAATLRQNVTVWLILSVLSCFTESMLWGTIWNNKYRTTWSEVYL